MKAFEAWRHRQGWYVSHFFQLPGLPVETKVRLHSDHHSDRMGGRGSGMPASAPFVATALRFRGVRRKDRT